MSKLHKLLKESWLKMSEINQVKMKKVITLPGVDKVNVFLVDGERIENEVDVSFIGGSHHYYTKYVAENEIWLDDELHIDNRKFILLHEYVERLMMKYLKYTYDQAHEISNKIEEKYRHNKTEDGLAGIITEFFKSYFPDKVNVADISNLSKTIHNQVQ